MPGKRGRPTRLTAAVQAAICANLELALPLKLAAEAEGIPEMTVHHWIESGKEGREPYAAFSEAVTRAKAKAAKNLVVRSLAGGKGSANANFHLERRFREDYGPVQKLVVESESDLTDAERQEQLEAFKRTLMGSVVPPGPDGVGDPRARPDAADPGAAPSAPPPAP
jgi:hypothetical protein